MQVLSTEGVENWPVDAYRVMMSIEDHEPQIVQLPKTCLQASVSDKTNVTQYSVISKQVATIQKVIVTAMASAARESKKNGYFIMKKMLQGNSQQIKKWFLSMTSRSVAR
jgi:hypothetical protein